MSVIHIDTIDQKLCAQLRNVVTQSRELNVSRTSNSHAASIDLDCSDDIVLHLFLEMPCHPSLLPGYTLSLLMASIQLMQYYVVHVLLCQVENTLQIHLLSTQLIVCV